VARHLVAAGNLLDDDPAKALLHARAARASGARLAVVREAMGVAAYNAQEWREALSELRAAYRMSGSLELLPLIADSERAVGHPERALSIAASKDAAGLDEEGRIELLIVAAGARRDLGQTAAAVVALQREVETGRATGEATARLWYAYADALVAAGRPDDARQWFSSVTDLDEDDTDAADRLAELGGPSPR
jgi:tetratricopeptide (TPR) repeat protein